MTFSTKFKTPKKCVEINTLFCTKRKLCLK
jgi:hypothetical protein